MGNSSVKRELKDENRTLRGRLQELRKKDQQIIELKESVEKLKKQLEKSGMREKDVKVNELEELVKDQKRKIEQLQSRVDMYKSVHRSSTSLFKLGVQERKEGISAEALPRARRAAGISAEPAKDLDLSNIKKIDKEDSVRTLIKEAIQANDFMHHLEAAQIREIIDCMYRETKERDSLIIREGDVGDRVYVIESGEAEVAKGNKFLRTMGPQTLFGELAILYSTPRTASVRAVTRCDVWTIDRQTFQTIMMKTGMMVHQERLDLIKRVPKFKGRKEEELTQIIEAFDENHYDDGEYVVRQGAKGETFYIIASGKVKAIKQTTGKKDETRELFKGDYFGERGLEGEEVRAETMLVTGHEGADLLSIDRETLKSILVKQQSSMKRSGSRRESGRPPSMADDIPPDVLKSRLGDICILDTLGVGGFGRVELVQLNETSEKTYAMKQIRKHYVVETKQQDHILNERRILLKCRSRFIVRLFRTFRNNRYVYMVMEACLGGELWRLLRDKGPFDDSTTRFYTACTMESLAYLHSRGIVYRDLKPENLLLDEKGYVKLADFGFAKEIGTNKKTWTFCGTPEYVAPEIILNKGHDHSVDLWSLGVLMYELFTGNPPFAAKDPMKTYNLILKGIESIMFPRRISKNARELIKKLCRETPSERLGHGRAGIVEVQKHKWFDGFNWDGLRKQEVVPPMKPIVQGMADTKNFDTYPEDEDDAPEETSDWDRPFADLV